MKNNEGLTKIVATINGNDVTFSVAPNTGKFTATHHEFDNSEHVTTYDIVVTKHRNTMPKNPSHLDKLMMCDSSISCRDNFIDLSKTDTGKALMEIDKQFQKQLDKKLAQIHSENGDNNIANRS